MSRALLSLFAGVLCVVSVVAATTPPKVIFFVQVDDLGWGDVGWHRNASDTEVKTPTMDSLVAGGVDLLRHHVHYTCTPSRSSVQSGRLPVHVQLKLENPDNPSAGIPRNMTTISGKMKQAGYATHIVGKWDVGMATPVHTPEGRGYDSSLIYFEHKNDYWTEAQMQSSCATDLNIKDFWDTGAPARKLNGTGYEEFLFRDRLNDIINNHDESKPLFLFYTPHISHCPLQIPKANLDEFNFMTDDEGMCEAQTPYIYPGQPPNATYKCRQTYHAMVHLLDGVLANVTSLLRSKGWWDDTLMVLSSDNGGPLTLPESGANNHPLRGGKYVPFEGGVRAAAFLSGGYLPDNVRGTQQSGLIHIADWYTTFCKMVGVDPVDHWAAESGLPPVDGVDVWPLITGAVSQSPRTEIPIDYTTLIQGDWKLIQGTHPYATWAGPRYPNATSPDHDPQKVRLDCGDGCLFNVVQDPTEHVDLAASMPDRVAAMSARLATLSKSFYSNNETGVMSCPAGIEIPCACWMAVHHWGGFFGPYQEIQLNQTALPSPYVDLPVTQSE